MTYDCKGCQVAKYCGTMIQSTRLCNGCLTDEQVKVLQNSVKQMKCTLKAQCSKEDYLDNTEYSIECKYKDGFTYGFYEYKKYAEYDINNLLYGNITEVAIFDGWDIDGFVTFEF